MNIGFYPPRINFADGLFKGGGKIRDITRLRIAFKIGTFAFMKELAHQTTVFALSLWMMLIIPVTASHHDHSEDPAGVNQTSAKGLPGSAALSDPQRTGLTVMTVPCLLCGRVLNPLLMDNTGCEGFMPVTGKIFSSDPLRYSGKTELHRLGDRSPPPPPISS